MPKEPKEPEEPYTNTATNTEPKDHQDLNPATVNNNFYFFHPESCTLWTVSTIKEREEALTNSDGCVVELTKKQYNTMKYCKNMEKKHSNQNHQPGQHDHHNPPDHQHNQTYDPNHCQSNLDQIARLSISLTLLIAVISFALYLRNTPESEIYNLFNDLR